MAKPPTKGGNTPVSPIVNVQLTRGTAQDLLLALSAALGYNSGKKKNKKKGKKGGGGKGGGGKGGGGKGGGGKGGIKSVKPGLKNPGGKPAAPAAKLPNLPKPPAGGNKY